MRHVTRLALVLILVGLTAPFQLESAQPKPSVKSSCNVSRNCAYGPPSSVSCTSANGVCQSGPDNHGWVQCDGNPRIYCPGPCAQNGVCYSAACPTDPDCSACSLPSCSSLEGKACTTDKACSVSNGTSCLQATCRCFAGQLVCP
ncbi:MAG TPA: hypothetical protein VLE27_16120 [Thermoanaerobaculia bacterium]|nr:hypothetical protein [Thermoanaerobaculia bacterium]